MAGDRFYLKARDTLPVLEVALKNPDGTAHDLTGADAVWLHIRIKGTGTVVSREMTVDDDLGGVVSYAWEAADWDDLPQPTYPNQAEHRMEYEVMAGTSRLTFPNAGHDYLVITPDIGEAT